MNIEQIKVEIKKAGFEFFGSNRQNGLMLHSFRSAYRNFEIVDDELFGLTMTTGEYRIKFDKLEGKILGGHGIISLSYKDNYIASIS